MDGFIWLPFALFCGWMRPESHVLGGPSISLALLELGDLHGWRRHLDELSLQSYPA